MTVIAVFASGTGSNFEAILAAMDAKILKVSIALLVCDQKEAPVIEKAQQRNIPVFVFDAGHYVTKADYEREILGQLKKFRVQWLVLAGYMRLIGPTLLAAYPDRIINIHPSLLPDYKGKEAIKRAFDAGEKTLGVSIHFVDTGLDSGQVIAQEKIALTGDESLAEVTQKVHAAEHELYAQTLSRLFNNGSENMNGKKRRALLSVSDKSGITEFAAELVQFGFEIISTGGTKKILSEANIPVMDVSDVTEFPEMMDGRVKTLHPKIHGGLLAVRDNTAHLEAMKDYAIDSIELVVVNLYPFKKTVLTPGSTRQDAIENIDIGGPALLRSAAKNHEYVTVITDPADYRRILTELRDHGETSLKTRQYLAARVFQVTAAYDALIAEYLLNQMGQGLPDQLTLTFEKHQELRYGENPHQEAAFYRTPFPRNHSLAQVIQLHGKALSYNNIQDANAALNIVLEFQAPVVVVVKHTNPCGVGMGENLHLAWESALAADPVSIFGGVVATNQIVDAETAQEMHEIFLEIIIAPGFSEEAKAILMKKKNLRLLENRLNLSSDRDKYMMVSVNGGLLVQTLDCQPVVPDHFDVVTKSAPTVEEMAALIFAWKVVKHVKSNAIVVAKSGQTLGIGAGQMNRVGAADIALAQAGEQARGAVLSSEAFFPMADTLEKAAKAGIKAIIQPGGSIRDQESVDAANKYGIAMVFTRVRHFKH